MKFLYKTHLTNNIKYRQIITPVDRNLTSRISINLGNIKQYYDKSEVFVDNASGFMNLLRNLGNAKELNLSNSSLTSYLAVHSDCDSKFRDRAKPEIDYPYIYLDTDVKEIVKVISIDKDNYDNALSLIYPLNTNMKNTRIVINPNLLYEDMQTLCLDYQKYLTSILLIDIMEQSFYVSLIMGSLKGHLHEEVKLSSQPFFTLSMENYIKKFIRDIYPQRDKRWTYQECLGKITLGDKNGLNIFSMDLKLITNNQFNSFIILYEELMSNLINYFNEDINIENLVDLKNVIRQTGSNKKWVTSKIKALEYNPKMI